MFGIYVSIQSFIINITVQNQENIMQIVSYFTELSVITMWLTVFHAII